MSPRLPNMVAEVLRVLSVYYILYLCSNLQVHNGVAGMVLRSVLPMLFV